MQTPTPPTKPTPPTPPTMEVKPSSSIGGDSATSPTSSTTTNSVKSETTKAGQDAKKIDGISQNSPNKSSNIEKPSTSPNQTTTAPPPLGTYNETTTATTAVTDITPAAKNKPTSVFGFGLVFTLILLFTLSFVALHLWNNKKKKERTILDYSESNEKELLDLMNSTEGTATPPPPAAIVKTKKTASSSKIQGNFEVRI